MANLAGHKKLWMDKPRPKVDGGLFGILGKPDDAYTEEDMQVLGEGLVEYIKRNDTLSLQRYLIENGVGRGSIEYLKKKYPTFLKYYQVAREIQQAKCVDIPFYKKGDWGVGQLVLRKGDEEWGKFLERIATEKADNASIDEKTAMQRMLAVTKQLQDSSALNKEDNNNNNESKS